MINIGLYEQLINKLLSSRIHSLDKEKFYINESILEKEEAAKYLSQYLNQVIRYALGLIPNEDGVDRQIDISNKIISLLRDELNDNDFEEDLLAVNGRILNAIFS